MDADRFKTLRSFALPADFEGHSTHSAPGTAMALDEIERLQVEIVLRGTFVDDDGKRLCSTCGSRASIDDDGSIFLACSCNDA